MKKLAVVALVLSAFSAGTYAHDAGEFFVRAGSATVRPTEGSDNVAVEAALQSYAFPYMAECCHSAANQVTIASKSTPVYSRRVHVYHGEVRLP